MEKVGGALRAASLELLRQSKALIRQGGLDESIHIFLHRPFERRSIHKQEAKLIITETASPSSWVYSPQILCSQPISIYLVSKMLNGTYLQRQD